MKILSKQEYCDLHVKTNISEEARHDLKRFHNIDYDKEIESVKDFLYQEYLNSVSLSTDSNESI